MDKIKEYILKFHQGTKIMIKEFFNRKTNKKQRANMWSFTRLLSSVLNIIPVTIGIITGSIIPYIIALLISGFGALTDYLDGKSARKYNSFSEYGKTLDQVADKAYALINGILISIINPLYIIPIVLEGIIGLVNYPVFSKYPFFSTKSLQIGRIKEWPLMISLALGLVSTISPVTYLISLGLITITAPLQIKTALEYRKRIIKQKKLFQINDKKYCKKDNLNIIEQQKVKKQIKPTIEKNIEKINNYKHRKQLLIGLKALKEELTIDYPPVNKDSIKHYEKSKKIH